jgi:hypothetical protein
LPVGAIAGHHLGDLMGRGVTLTDFEQALPKCSQVSDIAAPLDELPKPCHSNSDLA